MIKRLRDKLRYSRLGCTLTDRVVWRRWRAVILWYGSIALTALPVLPWWIHGPGTVLLIVLVSRLCSSQVRGVSTHLEQLYGDAWKTAEKLHGEHQARLSDLERFTMLDRVPLDASARRASHDEFTAVLDRIRLRAQR